MFMVDALRQAQEPPVETTITGHFDMSLEKLTWLNDRRSSK